VRPATGDHKDRPYTVLALLLADTTIELSGLM
jgi:hypothetical protein